MNVTAAEVGARIVAVAARFVGLTEIRPNAEWDDAVTPGPDQRARDLVALLRLGGWEPGAAYCASFCRGVWLTAMIEMKAPETALRGVRNRLSPSVMTTFALNRSGISESASPGSILLMQKGATGFGHAGIVAGLMPGLMGVRTIEANTSNPGARSDDDHRQREGDGIFQRERRVEFRRKPGLWLRGFLPPPTW